MSVSDSGSWKLFLYPLIIVLVIGGITGFILKPFIDDGIVPNNNNLPVLNTLNDIFNNEGIITSNSTNFSEGGFLSGVEGVAFWILGIDTKVINDTAVSVTIPKVGILSLPKTMLAYVIEQANVLNYLPEIIALPILILITFSLLYAFYVIGTMLIP